VDVLDGAPAKLVEQLARLAERVELAREGRAALAPRAFIFMDKGAMLLLTASPPGDGPGGPDGGREFFETGMMEGEMWVPRHLSKVPVCSLAALYSGSI
jgi:hypothetical protein